VIKNGQSRDMQRWAHKTQNTNVRENRRGDKEWTI